MQVSTSECLSGLAVVFGLAAASLVGGDVGTAWADTDRSPAPGATSDSVTADSDGEVSYESTGRTRGSRAAGHSTGLAAPRAIGRNDRPRPAAAGLIGSVLQVTKPLAPKAEVAPHAPVATGLPPTRPIAAPTPASTPTAAAAMAAGPASPQPDPMQTPSTPAIFASPAPASAVAQPQPLASVGALAAVLTPTSGSGSGAPAESPVSWLVLGAVRRWGQPSAAAATINRAPVISSLVVGTPNTTTGAVIGTVTATDPNRDPLTYRATTSTKGAVVITGAGVFTYTPTVTARHAAAKIGAGTSVTTDQVTVTVSDPKGAKATATATVPISPKNAAPVGSVTVGTPNTTTGVVTGRVTATDADRDVLTYSAPASTAKGTVSLNAGTGSFTYTPSATARHGAALVDASSADRTDTFTVTVKDGYGGVTGVPVTVAVSPKNSAPVAGATAVGTPDANTGVVTGTLTATDADRDVLAYSAPATTAKGAIIVSGSGVFTYTPTAVSRHAASATTATTADRTDTFSMTVRDGYGGTIAVPVTVAISPRNTAPVAGAVTVGTPDANTGTVTGSVAATDADGDALTFSGSATTTKGAVTVSATGDFSYTPTVTARTAAASTTATTADKQDSFTVSINDAHGGTAAVSVTVAVSPSSAPPPPPPPPPPPTSDHVAVGMNLENVVDWSPAWTFTDAFKASRPWISQTFNPQTWAVTWDDTTAPTLDLDANGNVKSLKTWTQNGVAMKQYAGTLMFRGLGGDYAGGTYHAEWDGTGVVTFGFDAQVTSSGKTTAGRNFAELAVTPTDNGIYLRIEETSPTDPIRNINVWMPDYNGQSFRGQRWQPGASFSPFHPLFLQRLSPFKTLRFMGMQETNTSDIVTWDQRRDANDIRQGSGSGGTPSEPIVNGMSLEYMVELANELDADPWFNMPYQADDTFVRNFATYVSQHLDPGRTVYVEWANEVWNFGYGFEASQWVANKARAAGLDPDYGQWIVTGQEAKRDLDIWSQVFAGQSALKLVRVAAGWAAVDWVTNEIASNMGGSFDAIAFAPYITPTDAQRASYTSATTVDKVLADTRTNIATSVQWTTNHLRVAQDWASRLGRPIQLITYEGGPHLDGRNASYQNAFYAASNDARMGDIYRDYIKALDGAGLDLYMDFQFTGQAGAASWGDFAKLHRMDQSLATAYRYNAVVAGANGSLWSV